MDELTLIRRCIGGDKDAFRLLVEKHKDKIARVIYSMTGNKADVEDLTQDVFIKAYTSLDDFNFRSSFATWLYRIAVNKTIDHLRKKRITRFLSLDGIDEWLPGRVKKRGYPLSKVPEDIRRMEQKDLVRWALDRLKPEQRAILILREFEQLSHEEIAGVLKISIPAVKSRIFRAREELRKILMPVME